MQCFICYKSNFFQLFVCLINCLFSLFTHLLLFYLLFYFSFFDFIRAVVTWRGIWHIDYPPLSSIYLPGFWPHFFKPVCMPVINVTYLAGFQTPQSAPSVVIVGVPNAGAATGASQRQRSGQRDGIKFFTVTSSPSSSS